MHLIYTILNNLLLYAVEARASNDTFKLYAKKAGIKLIYLALLLFYVLKSPDTTKKNKSLIVGALGYFILPVDLIPDALPAVGFSDDLAALIAVYMAMTSSITPAIKAQARERLSKWFPEYTEDELDITI